LFVLQSANEMCASAAVRRWSGRNGKKKQKENQENKANGSLKTNKPKSKAKRSVITVTLGGVP